MDLRSELIKSWKKMHIDSSILAAFEKVPRENFVLPQYQDIAYLDQPLPTLRKQSISQPTTVAIMLQALELKEGQTVFEVGCGVGFQAALMGSIVGKRGRVVSVDVIPELISLAKKNIEHLGLKNVLIAEVDGSEGYPQFEPYDRAIVTAACPAIPQPIIDQLKDGGIVVAPVGDMKSQTLVRGKKAHGKLELEFMGQFSFVPMKGKYGFKEAEMYY